MKIFLAGLLLVLTVGRIDANIWLSADVITEDDPTTLAHFWLAEEYPSHYGFAASFVNGETHKVVEIYILKRVAGRADAERAARDVAEVFGRLPFALINSGPYPYGTEVWINGYGRYRTAPERMNCGACVHASLWVYEKCSSRYANEPPLTEEDLPCEVHDKYKDTRKMPWRWISIDYGAWNGLPKGHREELVLHLLVLESFLNDFVNDPAWRLAGDSDGQYITRWSERHPSSDIAESFLYWLVARHGVERFKEAKHDPATERVDPTGSDNLLKWIYATIPNRLAFFDSLLLDVYPISDTERQISLEELLHLIQEVCR